MDFFACLWSFGGSFCWVGFSWFFGCGGILKRASPYYEIAHFVHILERLVSLRYGLFRFLGGFLCFVCGCGGFWLFLRGSFFLFSSFLGWGGID